MRAALTATQYWRPIAFRYERSLCCTIGFGGLWRGEGRFSSYGRMDRGDDERPSMPRGHVSWGIGRRR